MDANGQRFWLALGGTPWNPDVPGTLELAPEYLRLASETTATTYPETPADGEARLALMPMARDAFGTRAFVDLDGKTIRATGAFPDPEPVAASPVLLTAANEVTDLALGFDGFVYVVTGGQILLQPLSDRYSPVTLPPTGLNAWRFSAAPDGGGWVLDRSRTKLGRVSGLPWPDPPAFSAPPPTAFLPAEPNPTPPTLTVVPDGWLATDEKAVALACSPSGQLAVLLWATTEARVQLVDSSGRRGPVAVLQQVQRPYSIAWLSDTRFAVLVAGVAEAIVYSWREGTLFPAGDIYPLRDHDGGPFLHETTAVVEYLAKQPTPDIPDHIAPRPLVALSLPALAKAATGALAAPLDSGEKDTAWHRLYVDACIPPGTGFTLFAAASDAEMNVGDIAAADWHLHHFGSAPAALRQEPRAAWVPQTSEILGQSGFCDEPVARDRTGLFTILLQRAAYPVRTLRGRFLYLRIELRGNLRTTPTLFALRAYGPRFSYQNKYLPALYRETLFGPEANVNLPGQPSTRPDFLGRFLDNFEGILTSIEDRVAESWLVTDPQHTPDAAIDWLGSWIGVTFAPWYPAQQRRRNLQNAPELFRRRGTLPGLRLALDIASGGGVQQGRVVVVEDYWFRRTLQTVLGVQLDRDFDPLLGGSFISGNSKVGDTLFLSEEGMEKKFLALFDASIELKAADQATVAAFFASLAYRVTVIVHETVSDTEFDVIGRVTDVEAPAHVLTRVRRANGDLMVGLTALLGVDTFLRPHPPAPPVEVGAAELGGGALLLRPPSLDPRLEGLS